MLSRDPIVLSDSEGDGPEIPPEEEDEHDFHIEYHRMSSEMAEQFLCRDLSYMSVYPDMTMFDELMESCTRFLRDNPATYELEPFTSRITSTTFVEDWSRVNGHNSSTRWVIGRPFPNFKPIVGRVMPSGEGKDLWDDGGYSVVFPKIIIPPDTFDYQHVSGNFRCQHYTIPRFNSHWKQIELVDAVAWWFASLDELHTSPFEYDSADFDVAWTGFRFLFFGEYYEEKISNKRTRR